MIISASHILASEGMYDNMSACKGAMRVTIFKKFLFQHNKVHHDFQMST